MFCKQSSRLSFTILLVTFLIALAVIALPVSAQIKPSQPRMIQQFIFG